MNGASKAVDYFKTLNYPCPDQTNPADFFMNLMSIEAYDIVDHTDEEVLKRTKTEIQKEYKSKI